jgi:hypothetical protein
MFDKGVNMKTTTKQIVALLSGAISASLAGDDTTATQETAQALRLLVKSDKSSDKPVYKSSRRGPKPALNTKQVSMLVERVNNGESIVNVAKQLGVSYATAHRYLKVAKASN